MAPLRGRPVTKRDYSETPAYGLPEAARYLDLAPATLRSWVLGREYPRQGDKRGIFKPLIAIADSAESLLSFNNLIEAHVLRALRVRHGVSIKDVRAAIDYAEHKLKLQRLLLRKELRATAGEVLLEKYGQLISLSHSGQLAMKKVLESHLERIEWDSNRVPRRLYPFVSHEAADAPKRIAIDPRIAFGRPVVVSRGITTAAIRDRIDAGESVDSIAQDYALNRTEVEQAVIYERAA
jgi:uncharacterized protein (DUF433 family)